MKYSYTNSLALIESVCVFKRSLNAIQTGPFFFFFFLLPARGEGGGRSPPSITSKPLILRRAKLNITMY